MEFEKRTAILTWMARAGYATRGILYFIVGGLAFRVGMGTGGKTTGMKGAIETIQTQPLGEFLLGAVGVGLIGYSIWRLTQAIANPDNHDGGFKGIAVRLGMGVSGIFHIGLAYYAISLLIDWHIGAGGSSGGNSTENRTADLMSQPFGRWLVLGAAIILLGMAIAHFIKAYRETYAKYLDIPRSDWTPVVHVITKTGLIARGAVYLILGYFMFRVFQTFDPERAMGLNQALDWLLGNEWGGWLLAAMAVGLIAFGAYSLFEAAHRRIDPPDHST